MEACPAFRRVPERKDKRGRRLPKPKINPAEAKYEQWKAFCLILLAGLRRAEDSLPILSRPIYAAYVSAERKGAEVAVPILAQ